MDQGSCRGGGGGERKFEISGEGAGGRRAGDQGDGVLSLPPGFVFNMRT